MAHKQLRDMKKSQGDRCTDNLVATGENTVGERRDIRHQTCSKPVFIRSATCLTTCALLLTFYYGKSDLEKNSLGAKGINSELKGLSYEHFTAFRKMLFDLLA